MTPLAADAFVARLGATMEMFADNKKARASVRWLPAAAHEAGYEPRVGQIMFHRLQPISTGTTSASEPEEAGGQHAGRKRKRRRKPRMPALEGLVGYYEAVRGS